MKECVVKKLSLYCQDIKMYVECSENEKQIIKTIRENMGWTIRMKWETMNEKKRKLLPNNWQNLHNKIPKVKKKSINEQREYQIYRTALGKERKQILLLVFWNCPFSLVSYSVYL